MDILKIVGKPLYQWDMGRKLLLTVPEGAEINEIQFSDIYEKSTLVVIPHLTEEKMYANIPNILLQHSGNLSVYAVMHTEDGEETLCHYTYKVFPKKKPEDYVYTDTEVLNYILLEKRIATLEKSEGDSGTPNAVRYVEQKLTEEEQIQARKNIGAANSEEVSKLSEEKVYLPKDADGKPLNGTVGQFATSDGNGGIAWVTVQNGSEVAW